MIPSPRGDDTPAGSIVFQETPQFYRERGRGQYPILRHWQETIQRLSSVDRIALMTHDRCKWMGTSMPLTGGQITGYDGERLAFAFTMMNGDEAVPCQISDAAMDELAGTKGTPSIARQAQFLAHREAIERIASDLYDEAPRFKGYVVRIFTKHISGGSS
jgi:hypothetical protein